MIFKGVGGINCYLLVPSAELKGCMKRQKQRKQSLIGRNDDNTRFICMECNLFNLK